MQQRFRVLIAIVLSALGAWVLGPAAVRSAQSVERQTIAYTSTDENFPNPERGFYHQDTPMWLGEERFPQEAEDLQAMRDEGITLVRWYFLIDEFRDRPLDDEVLAYIDSQLDAAREAGLKAIPRFAYNFPMGGEYPYQEPDAPLERVLEHIEQLTPILRENSDVIAFMEAGFVGAWGEWHSSTHHLVDEETGLNDASRAIIDALMTALPTDRMIAMRYAPYKQQLYGEEPLDKTIAHSGEPHARMGAHNDCFLASETDWGSYPEDAAERQALRQFLHLDNRFVVQGGETCNADAEAQPYIGCENALADLALLRFSTLNIDYHEEVLEGWRDGGCFEEIERRLGYRFRLFDATLPTEAQPGAPFVIDFNVVNEGFGNPYNMRTPEILLRAEDGTVTALPVPNGDARYWLTDAISFQLGLEVTLPVDLPAGEYEVLLNLPDPAPLLHDRPEYAIQLANAEVWEPETGYNRLGAWVQVG